MVIIAFACGETERIFRGERSRKLPPDIQNTARRKLEYLHRAGMLRDLLAPPGNRLEALKGDRSGQHSIRINNQWRICFVWRGATRSRWKLWIIIKDFMSERKDRLDPVHPGDVLREDFISRWLSAYAVAKAIGATPIAISEIIRRKRAVSAEMALKLGRLFNVSPELWMGIQADYDLEIARDRSEAEIFRRVHPLKRNEPVPA